MLKPSQTLEKSYGTFTPVKTAYLLTTKNTATVEKLQGPINLTYRMPRY